MYKRVCQGLQAKGYLIPVGSNPLENLDLNKDAYLSIYNYSPEQKKVFEEPVEEDNRITVRGCSGMTDVTTNWFVFDFDNEANLEQARQDAVATFDNLLANGLKEENICVYFSGFKGFALEFKTEDYYTPAEVKKIARALNVGASFDSSVYNANRIMRLPYTKHPKSGLYKIPITADELRTEAIDTIKKLASEAYSAEIPVLPKVKLSQKVLSVLKEEPKKPTANLSIVPSERIDLSHKPKWMSEWKYALQEGHFPNGSRNNALMILASTYRYYGFKEDHVYRMLKGVAKLQAERYGGERHPDDRIWKEIVCEVFRPTWNGGTYAEENFPDELKNHMEALGLSRTKPTDKALEKVDDIFNTFNDFAVNIEANTVRTGITELDNLCRITTSMLVGFLGSPGAGKTASVLNILNKHSNDGEASVFFSLDMGKPLVYQKLVQKHTGYDSTEVFRIFQEDEKEKHRIRDLISKEYENVNICFRSGARVEDLKNYIIDYQENSGKKVRMVAVDYLEKVVGQFSDATANSAKVAAELQDLANDLELCVIVLLQPQKIAGDPSEPILNYRRVKGASQIEQDCRVIISMYREGYNPQDLGDDKFITFAVLKNTMGELGKVDCYWEGSRGEIRSIDDDGRRELVEIRQRKRERTMSEARML